MTSYRAIGIRVSNLYNYILLLLLLWAAGGCATKPKPTYLFYPPKPNEPRLQYLVGFSSANQFFGQSSLKKFVVDKSFKDKMVGKPYGIAARRNEIVYTDSGFSGVGIIDLNKRQMEHFVPKRDGKMSTPINVAADAKGNLYVTDTDREQVLIFGPGPERPVLDVLGRKNEMKPCGLAIAGEHLYITDLTNRQVRIYRLQDRSLVRTIPRADDDGKGKLFSPTNVAVDQNGRVYVADPGAFCVQVYDAEGKHLRVLGRQGVGPGMFARPRGLAVDRQNRVYVVDAATQVVQLFDDQGRLLIFFGDPTITGPGATSLPAGVVVDYDNVDYFQQFAAPGHQLEYVILLTNQYGDPKISAYGFLKK